MLNEYRKNLAVIAVANKYDFVKSVLDAFSIELTFHDNTQRFRGPEDHDVHGDAGEFLTMVKIVSVEYLSEIILNILLVSAYLAKCISNKIVQEVE
jgi:hypothetical protein